MFGLLYGRQLAYEEEELLVSLATENGGITKTLADESQVEALTSKLNQTLHDRNVSKRFYGKGIQYKTWWTPSEVTESLKEKLEEIVAQL